MSVVTNYNINGNDLGNVFNKYTQFQTILTTPSFISVATDITGTYIGGVTGSIGATNSNLVYLSSNGGSSWSTISIETNLNCISINNTGQYIAVAALGGKIHVSNNYGSTWSSITSGSGYLWNCIKVSSTGQYMVAGPLGYQIFYSTNYGVNWTASSTIYGTANWFSFCMNSNATQIYVASESGVLKSTNFGSTWSVISNYDSMSIACNSNGTQILLGTYDQGVYLSINSGTTWINTNLPTTKNGSSVQYNAVSSSSSGQYLVASNVISSNISSGNIYFSNNYGSNWNLLNGSAGNLNGSSISSINNSSIIISLSAANGIYKYIIPTISNTGFTINNIDLVNYFTTTFGIPGSLSLQYISPITGYNTLINNVTIDISNYFAPIYTIYTSGINNFITTTGNCIGISAILIGGGGGGGSGGANSNGTGGPGGGGGGGAIGVIYIPNPNYGTPMTISYTIGTGGVGGPKLGGNGTGTNGTAGTATSITYNGITYYANGGNGGGGGTNNVTPGTGGIAGSVSGGTFNYQNNGVSGSNGMIRSGTNRSMGGIGGLSGNYNITYNIPPTPSSNVSPTPTITYTINFQNVINDSMLSLINKTNITQPGNNNGAPTVTYNTYYGQGGYGGYSDTDVGSDYGYAGSDGQPGLLIFTGCSITYNGPPFTLSGTATSQIINGYNLITVTKGSGTVNLYVNIPSITIICVAGGGGGNAGGYGSTVAGGGGGGGSSCYINTSLNANTTISLTVGGGGSQGTNINSNGLPGSGGNTSLLVNYTTPTSDVVTQYNIICGGGVTTSTGTSTINQGGKGGTTTVTVGSNVIIGAGGNGGNSGSNGINSNTELLGYFPIVSNLTSVIQTAYGGGGGGGIDFKYGGTSGNKGIGGIAGNYSSSGHIGQSATTYGDGGGGAGYANQAGVIPPSINIGGNGGNGIAYIYFPVF